MEDVAYVPRPSSSFAPSPSGVEAFLVAIISQIQLMYANFGSHLDHIFDKMCQMNTRIGGITCQQSHLGSFAPSPSPELVEDSSNGRDNDDDASSSEYDAEMTPFP